MKQAVEKNERMRRVLESAARFQAFVPYAVLVGGTAVSAHLGHRESLDHNHVLCCHDWSVIVNICRHVAEVMLKGGREC